MYEVGSEMEYHECGNVGRVLVLACERVVCCGAPATRVRLRALEQLGGSAMVYPIEAGHEWDAVEADNAGAYAGWFLFPANAEITHEEGAKDV